MSFPQLFTESPHCNNLFDLKKTIEYLICHISINQLLKMFTYKCSITIYVPQKVISLNFQQLMYFGEQDFLTIFSFVFFLYLVYPLASNLFTAN